MTHRENYLKALEFDHPQWIPCSLYFSPLTWKTYREELEKIVLAHPRIFPEYRVADRNFYDEMPLVYRQGEYFRDNWGCLWYNNQDGLEGQVVEHPLSDGGNLKDFRMPDPMTLEERGARQDWGVVAKDLLARKKQGFLATGNGERLFDRLYFLRGFENLMMDIAADNPQLSELTGMLEDYEMKLVDKWLSVGVDMLAFHTDIGSQKALMISPAQFRRHVKPMFRRIFQTCRSAGVHVSLSSDGCLLEIVDDLLECGVSVHDPQLRSNTLEGIVKAYKGRLCANVDLDRQSLPFASPAAIRDEVKRVVEAMGSPRGGLMVGTGIYGADVPLRNIEAICEALEGFCFPGNN